MAIRSYWLQIITNLQHVVNESTQNGNQNLICGYKQQFIATKAMFYFIIFIIISKYIYFKNDL